MTIRGSGWRGCKRWDCRTIDRRLTTFWWGMPRRKNFQTRQDRRLPGNGRLDVAAPPMTPSRADALEQLGAPNRRALTTPGRGSCLWCAGDRQNCGLYMGFSPCDSGSTGPTESVTMIGRYWVLFLAWFCRVASEIFGQCQPARALPDSRCPGAFRAPGGTKTALGHSVLSVSSDGNPV